MPRGVCAVSLAGSAAHSLSNLLQSGTENTSGEWLELPTCRGCCHSVVPSVVAATLSSLGNSPAARRRWEHLRAVVVKPWLKLRAAFLEVSRPSAFPAERVPRTW